MAYHSAARDLLPVYDLVGTFKNFVVGRGIVGRPLITFHGIRLHPLVAAHHDFQLVDKDSLHGVRYHFLIGFIKGRLSAFSYVLASMFILMSRKIFFVLESCIESRPWIFLIEALIVP